MVNPIIKIKSKKGIVLIVAYLVLVVMIIFTAAFLNRGIFQNRSVITFQKNIQAFNLAEAGLDQALVWLRAQPTPPTGVIPPITSNLVVGNYTGTFSVTITNLGNPGGNPGVTRYSVASTGTVNNINRVLKNYIETDNYARYIWFTDGESYGGTPVWFWSQDYLNGPTHTNDHFNIYGNPTFAAQVESVDTYIEYYNNGNNKPLSTTSNPPYDIPNFQAGMTFGVNQTNMPTQALNLRSAAYSSGGLWLTGNTTIALNSTTMNVTNTNYYKANCTTGCIKNCSSNCTMSNQPLPANGALFVSNDSGGNDTLTISGTLSGRLTVGAAGNVNIPNSILYNNDPRVNPTSTDTLGLISEQNVVIASNAPNNLEIDASVMALNTSFMVNNWSQGPAKGTLTVYGGIIQDQRGPVGTFSGSTKLSGYTKNYSYDSRLLNNPPPFYPTTGDYITLSWEED